MKKLLLILFITLVTQGCSSSEKDYDTGYKDGYATGNAMTCGFQKSPKIKGDFDNKDYKMGFHDGTLAGSQTCK
jgi:hypothetical protein